ncbi:MAG: hypothetical protein K6B72_10595 [Lachnospiraceae bacterium]|nr:hypothetical protein [Lachnospiraceae bacterium]
MNRLKAVHRIFILIGMIFTFVGACIFVPFLLNRAVFGWFFLFPLFFVVLGIAFIIPGILYAVKQTVIMKNGRRIPAKIYGYVEDRSVLVNNAYPINVVVHYFDRNGTEREAILETGFTRGSSEYPLGMTIDIFEYRGQFGWDRNSVRSELLAREDELMDNLPVNTAGMEESAIVCPACGASFSAVKGYVTKCPYCSRSIDA